MTPEIVMDQIHDLLVLYGHMRTTPTMTTYLQSLKEFEQQREIVRGLLELLAMKNVAKNT